MTPMVQGEILVYRQGEKEQALIVGTADWFAWLETASAFSFVSAAGTFTARREQSGHKRGGWYWKAYRRQHGKLASRYLGKAETWPSSNNRDTRSKTASSCLKVFHRDAKKHASAFFQAFSRFFSETP